MKTSLDYKKLFGIVAVFVKRYRVLLSVGLIVFVLGFAVFRISVLSSPKADEEALVEALANYKEVKINEETVTAIKNLIDSDVEVNPSFDNRNNPFSD